MLTGADGGVPADEGERILIKRKTDMKLKEFINNTLTQIAEGVPEAIDNSVGKGYLVSPASDKIGNSCTIHFDIAVESEAEGKAGIKVVGGGISKRSANRISFDLTMTLPRPENPNVTAHHKLVASHQSWVDDVRDKDNRNSHETESQTMTSR